MLTRQMLPSSHLIPINGPLAVPRSEPAALASAFSDFIAAAGCLERSYQDLQREVSQLRQELEERNAALKSVALENHRMRLALQRIVGALPCGVLVFEADHTISLANAEARRLLGLAVEGPCSLQELAVEKNLPLHAFLRRTSENETEQEFRVDANLPPRWIAVRSRRLFSANSGEGGGVPSQSILTLRDISAQKELEQEREAARRTLALAEMSAVLAHEIRNPLASLELFADLIADEQPTAAQHISHLQAGIRTLSATVNNVLRFQSVGQSHLSPTRIAEVVRNSVAFIRPIAQQAGVEVLLRDRAGELRIAGEENALQQVMLNLSCNAIRSMSGGGTLSISVRATRVEDVVYASIRVADTGHGICPEHLDHIFEPGFSGRGDTPGLGLAVCRRIVEQHGGKIQVRSRVNRGTVFTLELPAL